MMRQSSSRNQRSKGLKTKSFFQIFVLAAVCFWLFYQLKHSLDKKRAMDERGSRMLVSVDDGQLDLIKLGRKDIPQTEIKSSRNDINSHKEDESEEVEEEEEDQEVKRAMEDLEGRGNRDDDIDDQDHEVDDEQEGQLNGDEDAESAEDAANEEEKEIEDPELMEEQEHDDVSHEARDASYNKDDASSAVHRGNQETRTEQQKHPQNGEGEEKFGRKIVEPDEAAIVKVDGSLKVNGNSSSFGSLIINDTISGNNITVSVGEAHLELQTNSTPATTNDTDTGSQNFISTSNTTVQNETLGIASAVSVKEEDNKIQLKGIIEESTDNSNKTTIGQDNLDEHSSESLATDIKEETTQSEVDSASHRIVTEQEEEASIDLSTLPDIETNIKSLDEDSALNEI